MLLIGRKQHKVYTIDEANDAGIDYSVHWSEVKKGQWTSSDDGYVMECLAVYTFPDGTPRFWWKRFPHASLKSFATEFNYQEFREAYSSGLGSKHSKKIHREFRMFIKLVARGASPMEAVSFVYPKIKNKSNKIHRIMRKDYFQGELMKELLSAFEEKNIDNPELLDKMLTIIDRGMESKVPSERKLAFDGIVKLLDMLNGEMFKKKAEMVKGNLKEAQKGGYLTAADLRGIKEHAMESLEVSYEPLNKDGDG